MTDYKKNAEIIDKAITNQYRLTLTIVYGLGGNIEVDFDPYIHGDDTLQNTFIFGYLASNRLLYKFRLTDIVSAKLSKEKFTIIPHAWYYYALEEELWNIAPDFDKINALYTGSHIGG